MTCSGRSLLQPLFFLTFTIVTRWTPGFIFLVIYPLVSTLHYGLIPAKPFSSIKRKAFQQPIVLNNDSSLKSLLFTTLFLLLRVHLWHQSNRLDMARYLLIDVRFCSRSRKHIRSKRKHVHTFWNRIFTAATRCNLWQNWHPYPDLGHRSLWEQFSMRSNCSSKYFSVRYIPRFSRSSSITQPLMV